MKASKVLLGLSLALLLFKHGEGSPGGGSPMGQVLSNVVPNTDTTKAAKCECQNSQVCLTEECIMAASTILSSIDTSVDPCEDFYQFACGGWIKKSIVADRFTLVDKRNQNYVRRILESPITQAESSADTKAKNFYKSCLNVSSEHEKVNLDSLLQIMEAIGGWHITGQFNENVHFDERVQRLHNVLGVNVFFTWGVIEQEGQNRLALIAGGWSDALIVEDGDKDEYLKLMSMYTMLLSQAEEETVAIAVDIQEVGANNNNNASMDIFYEYEDTINQTNQEQPRSLPLTNTKQPSASMAASAKMVEKKAVNSNGQGSTFDEAETRFFPSFSDLLEERAKRDAALLEIIQFEEALGNITEKPVDGSNLVAFQISQLDKEFGFLNWTDFFYSAFKDVDNGSNLTQNTQVLIQEDYVRGVHNLIEVYRASDKQTVLENYIVWRAVAAFIPDRHADEFKRRESCLKQTEDMFAPAVTSMYIKAKGVDKSRLAAEQVTMMVKAMHSAFKENLNFIKWMSPASAEAAKAKLEHMADLIGYPAFVLNDTWLDLVYKELDVSADHYLMNVVKHRSFARKMELRDFFESPERGTWNDFSHMANIATVNAYYNQATNTMVVPIGMLQPPLFWSSPKSLTFGAFGIVVAHEITHAFDEVGITYDAQGHFKPLYDNDTIAAFLNASDCIRNQYSEFTMDGVSVDGNITLGENIADHGGLKIAEIAYDNWLKMNNGTDAKLPALEGFTPSQLFYLGYALPWCALNTEAMFKNHVMKDEHAPDKFRVQGPLSNSQRFSQTWQCSPSSSMNPPEKCHIWGN